MWRNLFLLTVLCFAYSTANPVVEREFRRVIDSNQCLKECMKPVQDSNLELSVYKRSNYSDYFLHLDQICSLIADARHCINNCGIRSNPFSLISMNIVCAEKSRENAKLLETCFANVGTQVQQQCAQACGDYEQLNDQIHLATSTLKPEDQTGLQSINEQTNSACATLKCSARCAVDNYNRQCGHLANGELAGDVIRALVERVLVSYRTDLQVFGLLESMRKNTQPECNYLHTSDVLFDSLKDMIAQQTLRNSQSVETPRQEEVNPEEQLKRTANQLYVRVLKKQLQVLNKQLELMDKKETRVENTFQPTSFDSSNMF